MPRRNRERERERQTESVRWWKEWWSETDRELVQREREREREIKERQRKRREIKCQVHCGPFCPETAAATTDKSSGAPSSIGTGKAPGIIQRLSSLLLGEHLSLSLPLSLHLSSVSREEEEEEERVTASSTSSDTPAPHDPPPPPFAVLKQGKILEIQGAQNSPTLPCVHFFSSSSSSSPSFTIHPLVMICIRVCVCWRACGMRGGGKCEQLWCIVVWGMIIYPRH